MREAPAARRSVIVVGAGLAGLTAARALAGRGVEVTVVEARERIGGRIWTSRAWPDLPMDLGASWIHGARGNPLTALADAIGAERRATSYDATLMLDADGGAIDMERPARMAQGVLAAARAAAGRSDRDLSLCAAIEATPAWASADGARRRLIRHFVNGTVEAEYSGSWSQTSARRFDDIEEFAGEDVLFPGGFDRIVDHLAAGLTIRVASPVARIAPAGKGVVLTLRSGEALTGDHALVTVPLGVLKAGDIAFAEALRPSRLRAIGAIGMGVLNKCWLRFDKVAWPARFDWIEWSGPRPGYWAQWLSLARATGAPALLALHAGDEALDMERLSDAEMTAEAHRALQAMFGRTFPAPSGAQITRWSRDPLAYGAYSFNAVGVTPAMRSELAGADWDGRLVFAGEACEPKYFGAAHGAVLSGRKAARAILAG